MKISRITVVHTFYMVQLRLFTLQTYIKFLRILHQLDKK